MLCFRFVCVLVQVIVPAICDFVATYMMNVGLLWINASIWQMLRGSIVLFAAIIRLVWCVLGVVGLPFCVPIC
jgi:hypothetical protein